MRQDLDRKMLASVREYNLIGVPFYITINPNQQHSYMFIIFFQTIYYVIQFPKPSRKVVEVV